MNTLKIIAVSVVAAWLSAGAAVPGGTPHSHAGAKPLHPRKPYTCVMNTLENQSKGFGDMVVEAGKTATSIRGTATTQDGRAEIRFPEHFSGVTDGEAPLSVILTAKSGPAYLRETLVPSYARIPMDFRINSREPEGKE